MTSEKKKKEEGGKFFDRGAGAAESGAADHGFPFDGRKKKKSSGGPFLGRKASRSKRRGR